ncbi:MAG: hypothetical protein ACXWGX_03210 [Usitatibacter sp.]
MQRRSRSRGTALVLAALVLFAGLGAIVAMRIAELAAGAQRERVTERALAQAREALIAYAADRPITTVVGPGYLPCPDLDDDGWAEAICGSLKGELGREQRLGRLPWKTLGLPDLRDGYGERLWYAVSSRHKGLLNCAASRPCLDMSPATALGFITVRDNSGALLHDGTLGDPQRAAEGGAVAVVIAPGPPLSRAGPNPLEQQRDCRIDECDAQGRCLTDPAQRAARCNPVNYLDVAPGARYADEDNADFHDVSDAAGRARNANGFIQGPVVLPDGRVVVNDRIAAVSYNDLMPRVMMRVALEVAHCLRFYASRPENGGRLPLPAAACERGPYFGAIPDTPFSATVKASRGQMLDRWWRATPRSPERLAELPAQPEACRIALAPQDEGPLRALPPGSPGDEASTPGAGEASWWNAWRPFVFYALASGFAPGAAAAACGDAAACMEVVDRDGRTLAAGKQFAILVRQAASDCSIDTLDCGTAGCTRIVAATASPNRVDVAIALP